ncbi:MAG TPA: hypothetical protein VFW19_02375 [Allosphingosinicella sp.]|nr:hypothetical protein [Allosphingosinicella sp.]
MNRLAASFCLLVALAPAAPAAAQFVEPHNYGSVEVSNPFIGNGRQRGPGLDRELHGIYDQIHVERANGILSKREARALRREADAIAEQAERYAGQGMPQSARDELEARAHYLSDRVGRPR